MCNVLNVTLEKQVSFERLPLTYVVIQQWASSSAFVVTFPKLQLERLNGKCASDGAHTVKSGFWLANERIYSGLEPPLWIKKINFLT
jgi:hypothetical protein